MGRRFGSDKDRGATIVKDRGKTIVKDRGRRHYNCYSAI